MTRLRYPLSALLGDYVRGLAGLAISLVIVVTYDRGNWMIWPFVGLTLFFLIFTIRTALRQTTVVGLDDTGLAVSQRGRRDRRIDWDRLRGLSLRYYAPRRAKKKGFGSLLGRIGLSSTGRGSTGYGSTGWRATGADQPGADIGDDNHQLSADGWMELSLRADGGQVMLDSALPQFAAIVQRAQQAALANGIELDPVSSDNLTALAMLGGAAGSIVETHSSSSGTGLS